MKKLTFLAALFMLSSFAIANGLLTNTNQSAQFTRMMSRNASLEIDAVFFNPAGIVKLKDGWHFAVSNQTILQDKSVYCGFPLLNDGNYNGTVTVPAFPTAFAAFKKEKWAFSFGFGPNGGGGSAEFDRGLPSFEIPISKVVPGLAGLSQISPALSVTGYDADLYFTGSSVFWGFQLGAAYEINEMFSVFAGVRYMPAKNVYQGSIKNIQLEVGGSMTPAPAFLTKAAGVVSATATASYGVASGLQPIVAGGGGAYTLTQVQQAGYISATDKAKMEGGLKQMGYTQAQIDVMPITTVQGSYTASGNVLTATAATLNSTSAQLADKEVDTEQTGAGFTPIIGLNISPNEDWNFGFKYEHKTYMTLKNNTTVDDLGLFPDGKETASDVPAILGIGVGYKGLKKLEAQLSYNLYFDKRVDWGMNVRDMSSWKSVDQSKIRHRDIENNSYDLGLGLQYNLTDKFSISAGGLYMKAGVADSYQSDFSYQAPSYIGIGTGIMWKITDKLTLDAGFSDIFYKDVEVTFTDPVVSSYNDVYGKASMSFAVGLSYSIF
jgi:long-chain fatty acid transport protein